MEKGLAALRKSTTWFIAQDPTDIVLTPRASEKGTPGPGGGLLYPPGQPRPSQRVKTIHLGGRGTEHGSGGLGAEDRNYQYAVVMEHDGQVAIGDTFFIDGNKFIVDSFAPNNGYEVKFYAKSHGSKPSDG